MRALIGLFGMAILCLSGLGISFASDTELVNLPPELLQARVIRDTTLTDRRILVLPVVWTSQYLPDIEVAVARTAFVVKHGERISPHDIRTGDYVEVQGFWREGVYVGTTIRVNEGAPWEIFDDGRNYKTVEGCISEINLTELRLVLDTPAGPRTVYVDRARIWQNGDVSDLRNVETGCQVRIRGNVDGDLIDAERIELF